MSKICNSYLGLVYIDSIVYIWHMYICPVICSNDSPECWIRRSIVFTPPVPGDPAVLNTIILFMLYILGFLWSQSTEQSLCLVTPFRHTILRFRWRRGADIESSPVWNISDIINISGIIIYFAVNINIIIVLHIVSTTFHL